MDVDYMIKNEFNRGYSMGYDDALNELEAYHSAQVEVMLKFKENAEKDAD